MPPLLRRGQRLGRYELLAQVGEGGMASVWLARSHGLRGFEKLVALKMIKAQLADDALFERWFLDEAKIAQRIFHTNVATTLDLGEEHGSLFLVMEWIDGDSLGRVRRAYHRASGKPLPLPIALRIVADMCKGLHAAHELTDERGEGLHIVHRDVSPNNVIVTSNGAVKLIDFGIATARDRSSPETTLGIVRGKINYLAPEQIHRRTPLDRRSDVWAAGVCLYELVAGTLPFTGKDSEEVMQKIVSEGAPPSFDGDPDVDEILCRSLAHHPEDRFATALEMQRAIESLLEEHGGGVTERDVATFLARELPGLAEERRAFIDDALSPPIPAPAITGPALGAEVVTQPTRGMRGVLALVLLLIVSAMAGVMMFSRERTASRSSDVHADGTSTLNTEPPVATATTTSVVQADHPVATAAASAPSKKSNANVGTKKPPARAPAPPAKAVSSSSPKERDLGF
ncbi:serine/threonine protein kinase [Pendulispora brunnea]|uniref:Serine/threonine protein kinase n=1 Tax=Pendulispora brunnea TaxID=2905690 RepID=A0ABZ2KG77_9BACT